MRKILSTLAILAVAVLAMQGLNLVVSRPSGTALTLLGAKNPHLGPLAALLERKCANCHTSEVRLPVYARLPLARSLIRRDRQNARRAFDLVTAFLRNDHGPAAEPALAKLEHQVESERMPLARYRAMHWDAHLHASDRQEIAAWIGALRAEHYAPAGLPASVQANAIHPLPEAVRVDASKAALGEKLYNDPRLSGDNTISCATCHDLAKGGCDNQRFSSGIHGQRGGINAPTTFNSGFQFAQFWDGRAATLEDQAAGPPANPVEMGSNWDEIATKLASDAALSKEFLAVYPDGFRKQTVTDAIAEFERTLVTPRARFDRFLIGDTNALTNDERRGYEIFRQRGCYTCHVGKLLGGQSYETMGRRADYFGERGNVGAPDNGRFNVTDEPADRCKFKVPTLRNAARTHPYMHDGTVPDLRQAVRVMARYQVGEPLRDADVDAVAQFLESLTGEYRGRSL